MKYVLSFTTVGFLVGSVAAGLLIWLERNLDCAGSGLCGLAFVLAPLILLVQLPWIALPGVPQSMLPYLVALNGALLGLAAGVIHALGRRPNRAVDPKSEA